jgi:Toprim domain
MSPAQTLALALRGHWHGRYGSACCPAHADRNPSLSISDSDSDAVLVHCHGGCEQRAVIAALQGLGLWPNLSKNSATLSAVQLEEHRKRSRAKERERQRRETFIRQTWEETWATGRQAFGSPIETWLRVRGISLDSADFERLPLRWAPRCPLGRDTAPAMVALMTDALTAEPSGLHRTFLISDGSAKAFGKKSRTMLGKAGVIRLSPDEAVSTGLGICEGIETGLALMAIGWYPIWAAGSVGALARFPLLRGIECLTVFADAKVQEVEGARACAARWAAAGREAIVRIPAGGDWNDLLKAVQ